MATGNGVAPMGWQAVDGGAVLGGLGVEGRRRGQSKGVVKARPAKLVRKVTSGRVLSGRRKLALVVGAVGTGVLGLSVTHCTEAISLLTGSHWAMAGLLAVGIDAGMVAAECAERAGKGLVDVKHWARGYVVVAIGLSMLLNAYAFGLHAADGMVWAAWTLGAVIPGLVYALARVAGGLWDAE